MRKLLVSFATVLGACSVAQVTVDVSAQGGGTASASPGGGVEPGTVVAFAAVPAAHHHFTGWTGPCAGQPASFELTVIDDTSCQATFAVDRVTLRLTVPDGGGSAVVDGCSADPCTVDYGTIVTIRATPDTSHSFVAWSGGCAGKPPTATLAADTDLACAAGFAVRRVRVTPVLSPQGGGTYTATAWSSETGHVVCDATGCTLDANAHVTLVASQNPSYQFMGWTCVYASGLTTHVGSSGIAVLALDDVTCTATFVQ